MVVAKDFITVEDFMFQLTREEVDLVRSQNATSRENSLFSGQDGGRRKLPYVFTEQGIYMLATVPNRIIQFRKRRWVE